MLSFHVRLLPFCLLICLRMFDIFNKWLSLIYLIYFKNSCDLCQQPVFFLILHHILLYKFMSQLIKFEIFSFVLISWLICKPQTSPSWSPPRINIHAKNTWIKNSPSFSFNHGGYALQVWELKTRPPSPGQAIPKTYIQWLFVNSGSNLRFLKWFECFYFWRFNLSSFGFLVPQTPYIL